MCYSPGGKRYKTFFLCHGKVCYSIYPLKSLTAKYNIAEYGGRQGEIITFQESVEHRVAKSIVIVMNLVKPKAVA